ncbi:site-specific integrase, partial [Thermobifida halotolerans]|uniref:hypothetical protein n=1 Tax=Thermobifida halotolerans TaxID=483545 RepID=UPI001F30CEEC
RGARPETPRRAYVSDWRRWWAWCVRNDRPPLPASPADLAVYLATAHLTDPATGRPAVSAATIDRWSAVIAVVHTAHGLPNPTTHPALTELLRLVRSARPGRKLISRPLTQDEYRRLLEALPADSWPEAVTRRRDRLVLTLARGTGLGPDPLLNLPLAAVRQESAPALRVDTGRDALLLAPADTPLECAVCAFVQWREILDIADRGGFTALEKEFAALPSHSLGDTEHTCAVLTAPDRGSAAPLVRRLRRGGAIGPTRPRARAVNNLVHAYAERVGLPTRGLSAFSLRTDTPH